MEENCPDCDNGINTHKCHLAGMLKLVILEQIYSPVSKITLNVENTKGNAYVSSTRYLTFTWPWDTTTLFWAGRQKKDKLFIALCFSFDILKCHEVEIWAYEIILLQNAKQRFFK